MQTPQNWQIKNEKIKEAFLAKRREQPDRFKRRLNLSWSNWGFGMETLAQSARRLADNGIEYIELHGNRYGADLGYKPAEVRRILGDHNIQPTGICGMFSPDNEMASNRPVVRQRAIDYIRRNLELGHELGVKYMLVVPGAVGRPGLIDSVDLETARSVETLRIVAAEFEQAGLRAAIEPIRSAEVSIVHTLAEAEQYIQAVDHPGVGHINGDVYHMLVEESHIAQVLVDHGPRLTNLHLADTNRCALGEGSLDLDTIIMALYLIDFNNENCFATPEPLGPGGDPYPAMHGRPDPARLDALVRQTADYWRRREDAVLALPLQ